MGNRATVEVQFATRELAERFAPLMRAGDIAEGEALGLNPAAAVLAGVERSELALCALFDGEPAAIVGVNTLSRSILGGSTGQIWMLSAQACTRHPREFLTTSRGVLELLLTEWDVLTNWIDARYTGALRWAKWLGFEIEPPAPYGPLGAPFCRFTVGR